MLLKNESKQQVYARFSSPNFTKIILCVLYIKKKWISILRYLKKMWLQQWMNSTTSTRLQLNNSTTKEENDNLKTKVYIFNFHENIIGHRNQSKSKCLSKVFEFGLIGNLISATFWSVTNREKHLKINMKTLSMW